MERAPVHILGGGSIGLLLAGYLGQARPVTVIRRPGTPCAASLTVRIRSGDTLNDTVIHQSTPDRLRTRVRHLIVCTKAYDAEAAVAQVAHRLDTDSAVLLMQNGMSSQERIAAAHPALTLYAGVTTEGAYRPVEAEVVHAGRGLTRIGRMQGTPIAWAELFREAGLNTETVDDIRLHLADKLRVNALINPLTVLYGCRNGDLLNDPEAVTRMRRLGEEADTALAAAGFEFPEPAFERAAAVARSTAANVSSMLQDARAGRRLELTAITGYLVELGERHGVAVSAHRGLLDALSK